MAVRIGVFHFATQHSYQTALAFQESSRLRWYATPIYYDPSKFPFSLEKVLPGELATRFRRQMQRRYLPQLDKDLIRQGGIYSRLDSLANASGFRKRDVEHSAGAFSRQVIRTVEREPVDVLWGYDNASLDVFRWAKQRGIFCVLDRTTIASRLQNRIISEERAKNPDFFPDSWVPKSEQQLTAEEEEIALADVVVVGSSYCAGTLIDNGCPPEKIRVVNYGYDEDAFPMNQPQRRPMGGRQLSFLYAGRVSPLKGLVYLLDAFMQIPKAQASLTLLGKMMIPQAVFSKYSDRVRHISAVPRGEVVQHFSASDCFIFPSLFEGGGLVLREMYGAGLGCIQTPVGEGIIENVNGAFVRPGSTEDIVARVTTLIDNPGLAEAWCEQSWKHRKGRDWSTYREHVRAEVSHI